MNKIKVGGITRRSHFRITRFSIAGSMYTSFAAGDGVSEEVEADIFAFSSSAGSGIGKASVMAASRMANGEDGD
jgi:hypothetical protein